MQQMRNIRFGACTKSKLTKQNKQKHNEQLKTTKQRLFVSQEGHKNALLLFEPSGSQAFGGSEAAQWYMVKG
jgi:hypothetical protein